MWNIRAMKHTHPVEDWYALHEVYYNGFGQVSMWTVNPISITGDSVEELREYLVMCLNDLDKSKEDALDFDAEGYNYYISSSMFEEIIEDIECGNYYLEEC